MPDHLAFDTLQRFSAIRKVAGDLGLAFEEVGSSGRHLLDVGGFPASLSDFLPREIACHTVDRFECDREDYTVGTGLELPFDDASFPMAVACDTLEHVPPGDRERFVSEMARVSSRWVLICGPLQSAAVERAEAGLAELHQKCHGESHRWLSEHRAYGLPSARALAAQLAPLGSIALRANGWLPNWTLMMGLSFLDEFFSAAPPGSENPGAALSDSYGALREKYGPDDAEPAYRYLLLLDKKGHPAPASAVVETLPPALRDEAHESPEIRFLVSLLLQHLDGLSERFAPLTELGEEGVERGYAEQLEKSLSLAERSIEELESRHRPSGGGKNARAK